MTEKIKINIKNKHLLNWRLNRINKRRLKLDEKFEQANNLLKEIGKKANESFEVFCNNLSLYKHTLERSCLNCAWKNTCSEYKTFPDNILICVKYVWEELINPYKITIVKDNDDKLTPQQRYFKNLDDIQTHPS